MRRASCYLFLFTVATAACGTVSSPSEAIDAMPDGANEADALPIDGAKAPDAALTWSPFAPVAVDFTASVLLPVPSGDGRTVYFNVYGPGDFDIYFATRDTPDGGFAGSAPLPVVNVAGVDQRYPEISNDGLELYFSSNNNVLMVATRQNTSQNFGMPQAVRSGVEGTFTAISADKRSLYYVSATSGNNSPDGKLNRISRAAVGEPWSTPSDVAVPFALQKFASVDISADELSLLVAPPWRGDGTGSRDVVIATRASRATGFTDFSTATTMKDGFFFNSARWNSSATEIWAGQKLDAEEKLYVSKLR